MRHFTLNHSKGFTLVELVMTLVLISLLSSVAAVVVLGPFQTFYTMRDNIKLFSQFEQVSDDLEYYLSQAVPASVKISNKNQSVSFRTIDQRGWISLENFQLKGVIFFPDYPELGMIQATEKQAILSFLGEKVRAQSKENMYLRYQLLSEPMFYQFNSTSSELLRVGKKSKEDASYQALVGHLSDCEFIWFPDNKRLDIKISLQDNYRQQTYHFKQQMALD